MNVVSLEISKKINDALDETLYGDKKFCILYGGRGAGKTIGIIKKLIFYIFYLYKKGINDVVFLCTRNTASSLRDSMQKDFVNEINQFNLIDSFRVVGNKIIHRNSNITILFLGMQKPETFRSISSVVVFFMDEAQTLTQIQFDTMIPSIRGKSGANNKMFGKFIFAFNPRYRSDFIYKNFVDKDSKLVVSANINYYENPWFYENQPLVSSRNYLFEHDNSRYRHVWLGETIEQGKSKVFFINYLNYFENMDNLLKNSFTEYIITMDTAYKDGEQNDFSVIQVWSIRGSNGIYLIDQLRDKLQFPDLVKFSENIINNVIEYAKPKRVSVYIEDTASGQSLIQTLIKNFDFIFPWTPKRYGLEGDKVSRAYCVMNILYDKKIFVNARASWLKDYLEELDNFGLDLREIPRTDRKNIHDDQVDATVMAMAIYRKLLYNKF